jgi:hypothetical protein
VDDAASGDCVEQRLIWRHVSVVRVVRIERLAVLRIRRWKLWRRRRFGFLVCGRQRNGRQRLATLVEWIGWRFERRWLEWRWVVGWRRRRRVVRVSKQP